MANGFKLLGYSGYVSKNGHDSGTSSADDPRKTITGGGGSANSINDWRVIGAGYYIINYDINFNELLADGPVTIDGEGIRTITFGGSDNSSGYVTGARDITLKNCLIGHNVEFNQGNLYERITIKNCSGALNIGSSNRGVNLQDFKFIDSTITGRGGYSINKGHLLINSNFEFYRLIRDAYVDFNSTITPNLFIISSLAYCNIQGLVVIGADYFDDATTRRYAIQDLLIGTPQAHGYSADVKWLNETNLIADGVNIAVSGLDGFVNTCINRDPLFNNAAIGDYSLQAGSPNIGRTQDGISNIGSTQVGLSVINSDHNGDNVLVIPSPVDNLNLVDNAYKLTNGANEDYVDYIFKLGSVPLTLNGVIEPIAGLFLDSDYVGGTVQNNNVPDSAPKSSDYPATLVTTSDAGDAFTLNITGHGRNVGEFVRANGEDREITAVTTNSITVGVAFRSPILSGVSVKFGSENNLASLRPNRLTFLMRTSKQTEQPASDAEWDNDIDSFYGMAGEFLVQEWFSKPVYIVDVDDSVYGGGDINSPDGIAPNEIAAIWVNLRVFLRNDYQS